MDDKDELLSKFYVNEVKCCVRNDNGRNEERISKVELKTIESAVETEERRNSIRRQIHMKRRLNGHRKMENAEMDYNLDGNV